VVPARGLCGDCTLKTTSPAVTALLSGARVSGAQPLLMADCFRVDISEGAVAGVSADTSLLLTSLDRDVLLRGDVYSASGVQLDGLRYRSTVGLEIDKQQITVSADDDYLISGIPFMQAVAQGLLDGAGITRERAFFTSFIGPNPLEAVGSVLLFSGRVSAVDSVGRTSGTISVESDLALLSTGMPRRLYQANCVHTLYSESCGVVRAACTTTGFVGSSSTKSIVMWPGALTKFAQGTVRFLSGQNAGFTSTIASADGTSLRLRTPLPHTPLPGDQFSASWGCDHTSATCESRFSNLANFLGFPYVPPPQIMTGPMSSQKTSGK